MDISRSLLVCSVFFMFCLIAGPAAGEQSGEAPAKSEKQQSEIAEMLRAIGKKVSDFKSLKTEFAQEKELAMFKNKILLRGRIYLQKPNKLAWHVDKPVRYSVVITDKTIRQWDEDTNKVQEISLAKNMIFNNVVNQLTVWFSGDYGSLTDDNEVRIVQKRPLVIEFIPKEKNIARKMIKSITITFREDEKYLKKIKIQELSGDTTTINFSNTIIDAPLESSFFEVKRV